MITYSWLIGLGASLAILRVVQHALPWESPRWSNASLVCLLTSLIAARLVYVLLQWPYFKFHILETIALWTGGLSWGGAILGAYLGCLYMAKKWKTSILKLADGLSPMIPPLVICIWLGCWMAGFAYGWAAPQGAFWGVPGRDETGQILARFPLQLIAAVGMLAFAFWLETKKTPFAKEGQKFTVMQLGLAVNLLLFMPMRVDPVPYFLGLRLDVIAAILFFLFSAGAYFWLIIKPAPSYE